MKRLFLPALILITLTLIGWQYFRIDQGGILLSEDIKAKHPGWTMIRRPVIKEFNFKMDGFELPLTLTAHTAADSQGVVHIADFTLSRKPSPARLKMEDLTFNTTCCTVAGGYGRYNTFETLQISGNFEATKNLIYKVGVQGILIELKSNGELVPQMTTSEPGTYSWKHGEYVKEKAEK
ncbi:hypothetical protein HQ865_19400 [Mucilaginibacter mali]|uniref:Uncharacterized protein n=1 Tax=Mucilaginibacter mali TaxID=2740462 RepID=A0A7D4TZ30_9SPHI|nr:hypothetical protein [Mucilaginibacter mali]QKJ31837.1 hypothetical protein HQ865_19400 [Mucilaginibacter mali]